MGSGCRARPAGGWGVLLPDKRRVWPPFLRLLSSESNDRALSLNGSQTRRKAGGDHVAAAARASP